jgi:hypothetical protein
VRRHHRRYRSVRESDRTLEDSNERHGSASMAPSADSPDTEGDSMRVVNDYAGGEWWIERRVDWPDRRMRQDEGWTHSVERRWGLRDRRMQVRERELAVC